MAGLERNNSAAAEAVYALEMLGEAYDPHAIQTALVIDRTHFKARRRLARLS